MKKFNLSLAILVGIWAIQAFANGVPTVERILDLTKHSSYDSLLMHDSKVWAGIEGFMAEDPKGQHRVVAVDVSDPTDQLVVRIPHAAQYLYAVGPHQIMAVGMSAYGVPARWQSHYSLITNQGSRLSVSTYDFPVAGAGFPTAIMVKQFAALNGRLFFSLRYGENGLMEFTNKRARKLKPRITMPDQILPLGNSLFVIEKDNVDNVVRVELNTERATRLFPKGSDYHITRLLSLGGDQIVMTDWSRLIFADTKTFKVEKALPLGSSLDGLATFGSCLLVTDSEVRKLLVLDAKGELLENWDLSVLGSQFENARSVVADYDSGKIFVRATRSCPYCSHSPNSLALVEDPSGSIIEQCQP